MSYKRGREQVTLELHLRRPGIYDATSGIIVRAPDAPYVVDFGIINHSAFEVTISEYGFKHAWKRKGPSRPDQRSKVEARSPVKLVWEIRVTDAAAFRTIKRGFVTTLTGHEARSSKSEWKAAYRIIAANKWPDDTSETPGTPSMSFLHFGRRT